MKLAAGGPALFIGGTGQPAAASVAHAVALSRPAVAAGKEKIVSPPR